MLFQKRGGARKCFLHCCLLLLILQRCHSSTVTDQGSRILRRIQLLTSILGNGILPSGSSRNLKNIEYQQRMCTSAVAKYFKNIGYYFSIINEECTSIYASGSTSSGIYPIWLKERFQFTYIYCDMDLVSSKKGWTTIQRRMNGEINFNRGWDDYVRGFGNPRSEYWLGLENIYRLSRQSSKIRTRGRISVTSPELCINLEDWDGVKEFVQYRKFEYWSKKIKYWLDVADLKGNSNFSSTPVYRSYFSTPDVDNDDDDSRHCGQKFKSGWWFRSCGETNLNGPYPMHKQPMSWNNIFWLGWELTNPNHTALRFVSMNFYHSKP
ncbi:unnamed protein product [Clavelina lepadiformis]|uniref:Fibrinogen C-terminal domain-containing protein n=1 Tax=Clavelina lepadiformis TaxID=159417 RepID=A0ABP0G605_CLALP